MDFDFTRLTPLNLTLRAANKTPSEFLQFATNGREESALPSHRNFLTIPTGLNHPPQGCEERTTLASHRTFPTIPQGCNHPAQGCNDRTTLA
jgi:hypothetical protein